MSEVEMKAEAFVEVIQVDIGGYDLCFYPDGRIWMHGPEGDGMEFGEDSKKAFKELAAAFFKEHM